MQRLKITRSILKDIVIIIVTIIEYPNKNCCSASSIQSLKNIMWIDAQQIIPSLNNSSRLLKTPSNGYTPPRYIIISKLEKKSANNWNIPYFLSIKKIIVTNMSLLNAKMT